MRFPLRNGSIDDTVYLHTELSEQLLERLCQINSEIHPMSDLTMSLFSSDATRLRSARLTNATKLTVEGLRTLQGHKIVELEIRGLTKTNITDVIDECLGRLYNCSFYSCSHWVCSGPSFTRRLTPDSILSDVLSNFLFASQVNGVLKI